MLFYLTIKDSYTNSCAKGYSSQRLLMITRGSWVIKTASLSKAWVIQAGSSYLHNVDKVAWIS